jgi:hypothetical protein
MCSQYEHYSAFAHMLDALFLRDEVLMAIVAPDPLTVYCDASGKETDDVFVVGGALSTVGNWRAFDVEWKRALDENELLYFRMSEFAQSTGQFKKGWKKNEARRRQLLQRLSQIIADRVKYWMGVCIFKSAYDKANEKYQLAESYHPYTLCAHTCIELAHRWRETKHLEYLSMEYVFEEGDEHFGQLSDRLLQTYGQRPIPRKKIESDPNKLARPLQVSDFAAYEVRKAYVGLDAESEAVFQAFRKSFLLLGNIPATWGTLDEEKIRVGANMLEIPKRQP